MDATKQIETATELIRNANGLLIAAGADMCVDSGLIDLHDDESLWRAYPPLKSEGIRFQDIASFEAFKRDPVRAWGFYGHRLNLYRRSVPHEGFHILRRWAATKEHGAFVFTSNINGQFQKAGFDPKRILECHGSIHRLQCSRPCSPDTWSADDFHPEADEKHCRLVSVLPRCPECGSVARPNILMLNDDDWNDYSVRRRRMRFEVWLAGVERMVVIEVGAVRTAPSVHGVPEMPRSPVIRIIPDAYWIDAKLGIGVRVGALDTLRLLSENI